MNQLELLEVKEFSAKKRFGSSTDGGYVIGMLNTMYDCYISCGISDEESFTRDFLQSHSYLKKEHCYAFDGTIADYPWRYTKEIQFFRKNIGANNDDRHCNLHDLINKYNNIFLSIDIEGGEYEWLESLTVDQLRKFKQIAIEFHGMCGNDHWGSIELKTKCLAKLNQSHYIIHAHGNNNGPIVHSIPNVLELTYVNRDWFSQEPPKNKIPFPIDSLDYPNLPTKADYSLHTYPFVSCAFARIVIGDSKTRTKEIQLPWALKKPLYFFQDDIDCKDKFIYSINDKTLSVTRVDIPDGYTKTPDGWGQPLLAYYSLE